MTKKTTKKSCPICKRSERIAPNHRHPILCDDCWMFRRGANWDENETTLTETIAEQKETMTQAEFRVAEDARYLARIEARRITDTDRGWIPATLGE